MIEREPPYDKLIELLARDWGIEASWDGLRHFWYIGLTEECVRNRDEINEQLEDENAKLRELVKLAYDCATSGVSCHDCDLVFDEDSCPLKSELESMGIEVVE